VTGSDALRQRRARDAAHPRGHREYAVVALEARPQGDAIDDGALAPDQPHRPPRPHDRRSRREARCAPDDRRPDEAQRAAVVHHLGPPALARAPRLRGEGLAQRGHADLEVVALGPQQPSHVDLVRREHRRPAQDLAPVEHHREHGGDPVEGQREALALARDGRGEAQRERVRRVVARPAFGPGGDREAVQPRGLEAALLRPARHPARRSHAPTRRRGRR
jgi:hypothetical protein